MASVRCFLEPKNIVESKVQKAVVRGLGSGCIQNGVTKSTDVMRRRRRRRIYYA